MSPVRMAIRILCLCFFVMPVVAIAQTTPPNPFPDQDNQWHLGYSVQSYDSSSRFSEEKVVQMGDQSPNRPMEVTGVYTDATNRIALANPPGNCINTGPSETNACTFVSISPVQNDAHNIRYTYKNWGGRCLLSLRILHYAPVAVWKWADPFPWSTGSPFIVVVPGEATPQDSAVVFGKLNGKNIFFTPSDPLSAVDAKSFALLEPKKVVPGLGTVYRFQVK